MDYSKWKDIADSDDEAEIGSRADLSEILALKEAADRSFETVSADNGSRDRFHDCLQMYSRVVQRLDALPRQDVPEMRSLRGSCLLNMAAICTKLSRWQDVADYCQQAVNYTRCV